MKADDVYRFVALRPVASLPPAELHDPFVSAYAYRSEPVDGTFRGLLTGALASGDVLTARNESFAILQQQLGVTSAWALLGGTFYWHLFLQLPDLVRRGVIADAEDAMVEAFDVASLAQVASRTPEIDDQREMVANYLAACSLTGVPGADFDGAAHLLCCFETLDRILATPDAGQTVSPRRLAWRIPLLRGVVVLPFESQPLVSSVAEGLTSFDAEAAFTAPTNFIGDLIVLKQQLRRYELGEIAHVENVLAKEHMKRTHRTLHRTETKLLTVEETEKEVSRDMQSTTRDELSSEIQKAISEQTDLSANFNVTATYLGPSVTVTGSVGGSAGYRRASEERTATAMAHSQEVVSKASERVRQRTLTQREKIEMAETEQAADHGFDNDTASDIIGVYRWLERCFDLHLVNYGRRLVYEFIVPEPATYWTSLVSARGDAKSGPPPAFPQIPDSVGSTATRALEIADLSLVSNDGTETQLERPARWDEIVELAGQFGVVLEDPPPLMAQVHFALNAPGDTADNTDKEITNFTSGTDAPLYESGIVTTARSEEPIKIPTGYRAFEGYAAMKGWMYVRKGTQHHQFERGYAHLQLNGRDYEFSHGVQTAEPPGGTAQIAFTDEGLIAPGDYIEGDVPVLLTTSLNGLTCSIRLECERTDARSQAWSDKMFSLFAAAHTERVSRYLDDKNRTLLGNEDWAGALPSQTARAIEQRELKRGIVAQIAQSTYAFGDSVLSDSSDPNEPDPKVPALQLSAMPLFEKSVRFCELAFDWNNLAYIFAPYFYGRRKQWTELAVADNADTQFKAFLSAGAARVQVPIRRGYEAHVTYFFAGLGIVSFEQRVPWLASMRPFAEDLAADAREGFDLGEGTISVANGSGIVTGFSTVFGVSADVDREIRLSDKLYIIKEVHSSTEVRISPDYSGTTLTKASYELGGIVVGPAFPLKLATTLVAIDDPGLTLPTYPGRYAE